MHIIEVPCNCTEEPCRMELYVSDVRLLVRDILARLEVLESVTAVLRRWVTA